MKLFTRRLLTAPALLLLLLGIAVAGSGLVWWTLRRAEGDMRADLLRQAQVLGQALDFERLKTFTGTAADLQDPGYLRLKAQLAAIRAAIPQCRGIRLLGRRPAADASNPVAARPGGAVFVLAEVDGETEAEPGNVCDEAGPEFTRAFATATPFVEGPLDDARGRRISGMIPLVVPQSKGVLAVLGMDMDAGDWNRMRARAALPPALFTLVLAGIGVLGRVLLARRGHRGEPPSRWIRQLVPALVLAVGMVVTLFASWTVRLREVRDRELAFVQLAASRSGEIAVTMQAVCRSELESLACLFQHTDEVTSAKFEFFTTHLMNNPNVQAWEWAPAVPEAERARFEEQTRAAGLPEIGIWQHAAHGQPVAASGRDMYYPVMQTTPGTGKQPALGYDLGSDGLYRAALEEAAHSGLASGSDPFILVRENAKQKALLICRPVFADGQPRHVRGFVLAVLGTGTLLHSVAADTSALLDLALLRRSAAPEPLATTSDAASRSGTGLRAMRPVLAFGKAFVVTATAGPEFLSLHPLRLAWLTALTGLPFSATLAVVVSVLPRRREKLERLVMRRSSELRRSNSRLRAITDSAHDAIVMMDARGNISYWNPAAERILGYTPAEAIGQRLHTLIVPRRHLPAHDAAFPLFQHTGQGGAIGKTLDLEAVCKDGREISVQFSLSAIHTTGEWHALGILRDTTKRKRAEESLRLVTARATELAATAELANRSKSEFLAHMSHEIRTPMSGVIGMTDQLLDTALTVEQRHCAEIIRDSGEGLLNLINGILDLSKIEAGKLTLETIDFNLASVFGDLARLLAPQARSKGLQFVCAIAPEVPHALCGDPGRLRQVLLNLAGNAVKFTPHGQVAVRASVDANTAEAIVLRCVVSDTGIGIPADKQALLFGNFSQVEASTTRHYGGSGLGLAISKQLVELMGGAIGVTSDIGQGTDFWFTVRLPQALPGTAAASPVRLDPPAPPAPATDKRRHWHGLRVLLAEDNLINQKVALGFLKKLGLLTDVVENGAAAVAALATSAYDVVLMDMQMPVMDGLEATRLLRASPSAISDRRLPIIAMTANAMQGARQLCLDAGMNDYIAKPVTLPKLVDVLDQWLPRAPGRKAAEPEHQR